jgi:glycosyltransferase involved in cell wall biosynthesis
MSIGSEGGRTASATADRRRERRRRSPTSRRPRSERLRIALLAPVWFPVPPPRYGGIEAVIDVLAGALVDAGHDVTVFASGDSTTGVRLSSLFPRAVSERFGDPLPELRHVLACYERADEFDVISDHTGPFAVAAGGLVSTPVLHTVHLPVDGELGDVYERMARLSSGFGLISLSRHQRRARPSLPWVANCPNAVDPARFSWGRGRGGYLVFLGRLGPEKGCHRAIAAARECGLPLKIAAKCREEVEREYFAERVQPQLGDGIEYVGEIAHEQKVELLREARATLFPIDWDEPFGLVMIESLACGTPVIAMRRGSVPEVLEHGRTGIIVERPEDLAAAVAAADRLDPAECRLAVERRFSPPVLARSYLAAFSAAVERAGLTAAAG